MLFAATSCRVTIWRSDDCGMNWHMLADFGQMYDTTTFQQLAPYGTGFIKGTLDHLSVQTDSGMYLSTDQGYTWKFDGGPGYTAPPSGNAPFWSDKGYTFAARVYHDVNDVVIPDGLWMKEWGTSSVSEGGTSVSELNILSVEPNPAANTLRVGVRGPESGEPDIHLEIVDLLGHERMTREVSSESTSLDISSLSTGTYFLRLSAQGEVRTRRFVVER